MPLLVVGSVAWIASKPQQTSEMMFSGAWLYFSACSKFFSPVCMIVYVGEDWPAEHTSMLEQKGIDTSGIQIIPGGKTFDGEADTYQT